MTGYIDPDRAQFEAFKALDRDHPIEMLNLVKFRDRAAYPEGHELANAGLSGAEAYRNYGRETAPVIALIGPGDEVWDEMFIARYPSGHAFLEMVTDPAYRQAVVHRQAAVETSRLIRTKPGTGGTSFG